MLLEDGAVSQYSPADWEDYDEYQAKDNGQPEEASDGGEALEKASEWHADNSHEDVEADNYKVGLVWEAPLQEPGLQQSPGDGCGEQDKDNETDTRLGEYWASWEWANKLGILR